MNAMTPIEITELAGRADAIRTAFWSMLDVHPEDRLPLIEMLLNHFSAGTPIPAFGSVMAEASDWASWASTPELKAYTLASYNRMNPADQQAFLGFVQGRAAA